MATKTDWMNAIGLFAVVVSGVILQGAIACLVLACAGLALILATAVQALLPAAGWLVELQRKITEAAHSSAEELRKMK